MMDALALEDDGPGFVTIGFDSPDAAKKADWTENRTNSTQRKFLGVTEDELEDILSVYQAPEDLPQSLNESILASLIRGFGGS
jgi:hypothetical protein